MFKLIENPEFTHDVTFQVPVDGGHEEQTCKVRFRVVSDELIEAMGTDVRAFVNEVVVWFDDVEAEGCKPRSIELKEKMLAQPFVRTGTLAHYQIAVSKARAGN